MDETGSLIRNFDKGIEKTIYPEIALENQRKSRYHLYLHVGNMRDILDMTPWDFDGAMKMIEENPQIWYPHAKPKTKYRELDERNRDMIKRAKEMNK